ncbi:MAG: Fic family protein [Lachnospirales bacterium]
MNDKKSNNLIISFMFVLDFRCVHSFNDGNGRMSRLLTLLLLYRNDFNIGKYISIERIIKKTKVTYYETLKKVHMIGTTTQMIMSHL